MLKFQFGGKHQLCNLMAMGMGGEHAPSYSYAKHHCAFLQTSSIENQFHYGEEIAASGFY